MEQFVSDSSKANILVVDDDRGSAELIKMMLESRGYNVRVAHSGNAAIDLVQDLVRQGSPWHPIPVDVILLDIMMPGADGFKVCQRVKNDPVLKYIPVIMVTALNSSSDKVAAVEFGADGYITKPFLPEELSAAAKAKVQIKRREETLLRQNKELSAIAAVASAAASTLDPKRVLSESMGALIVHTDISAGAIYCFDEAEQTLHLGIQRNVIRPDTIALCKGLLGRIIRTQKPVLKVELDADAQGLFEGLGNADLHAYIGIPLRGIEHTLGVLEVFHRDPGGFTDRDPELFAEIGNRIGVALQNAEIFCRTQNLLLKSSALATGSSPKD